MKRVLAVIVVYVVGFLTQASVQAQCAMCRASVENNVSNGDTSIGAGLNNGILYLFVMPYLMVMIVAYFWYRSAKRKKAKLSLR